jgi:hypothetical protein
VETPPRPTGPGGRARLRTDAGSVDVGAGTDFGATVERIVREDDYLVVERADDTFLQAVRRGDDVVVEHGAENGARMRRARLPRAEALATLPALLRAFADGDAEWDRGLSWQPFDADRDAAAAASARTLWLAVAIATALLSVYFFLLR